MCGQFNGAFANNASHIFQIPGDQRTFFSVCVCMFGRLFVRQRIMQQYVMVLYLVRGMWRRSLLMHCATSRKVAGSILDGVTGIFH
jgi:hypothetical protein